MSNVAIVLFAFSDELPSDGLSHLRIVLVIIINDLSLLGASDFLEVLVVVVDYSVFGCPTNNLMFDFVF